MNHLKLECKRLFCIEAEPNRDRSYSEGPVCVQHMLASRAAGISSSGPSMLLHQQWQLLQRKDAVILCHGTPNQSSGSSSMVSRTKCNFGPQNCAFSQRQWWNWPLKCVRSSSIDVDADVTAAAVFEGSLGVDKSIDVVTLGNLCLDIVLNVPELPPRDEDQRYRYMLQLAASNPDKKYWEAGGNCNFAIAAARLGLSCVTLGEIGREKYGSFLCDILRNEGVIIESISDESDWRETKYRETLLCWVLVDAARRHGFCSRFDFNKEPAFSWINKLSWNAEKMIQKSKVLFLNGFAFDELSPNFITSILDIAKDSETAIFFDPGPRNTSLVHGSPEQQKSLRKILSMSDVLLLTDDEAESLTGNSNPVLAAQKLLQNGHFTKWVLIKLGSRGSLVVTSKGLCHAPAFKVDVVDTVGCGDSFAAAIVIGYINSLPLMTTLTLANAVGAATAMGCGAGRNVATLDRVCKLLRDPEIIKEHKKPLKALQVQDYFRDFEIMLVGSAKENQAGQFQSVEFQDVARDALNSILQFSQGRTYVSR